MTKQEIAAQRVLDALERNKTPNERDLEAARVCLSCYGFGYYYDDDDATAHDERTTCKLCGGDGRANV